MFSTVVLANLPASDPVSTTMSARNDLFTIRAVGLSRSLDVCPLNAQSSYDNDYNV